MVGRVVWSEEALDDIDAIAAYMARDSMTHARRFVSEVFCLVDLLVTQPRMGRLVLELRQETTSASTSSTATGSFTRSRVRISMSLP